jgi:hypothetical protein
MLLENEPYIMGQSLEYQFQKLMIDPAVDASVSIGLKRLVILIDGLDECNDKDLMGQFIKVVTEVSKKPGFPFRIFVASRVEEHI